MPKQAPPIEGGAVVTVRGNPLPFALSVGGYLFAAFVFAWLAGEGRLSTLATTDMVVWDRVGDQVRAGISPYGQSGMGGFFYAPPWALAFGIVSWLPPIVLAALIVGLEVAALRYVAGSWLRVGWAFWLPFVPMELAGLHFNLVIAAATVLALRGRPSLAVVMGLAKLSPFLAIDVRQWRTAALVLGLLALLTLPFAGWWVDWVRQLAGAFGTNIAPGSQLMIPLAPRLAIAGVLVLTGRGWARVIAVVIATPALYNVTLVGFLALVPLVRPQTGSNVTTIGAERMSTVASPCRPSNVTPNVTPVTGARGWTTQEPPTSCASK
jgi:hypothetical protein